MLRRIRADKHALILAAAALFGMLWVIARAFVQSLTIDEGDTYTQWVARPGPWHWTPDTNNHLLNSMLMRLFVDVFGASHLTLRAGAITGAAVYIAAALICCRMIGRDSSLQWILFVCATWNPFVMDYLVAARGYGLCTAFLLAALAAPAAVLLRAEASPRQIERACAISSLCAALAIASNLGVGLVTAAALCSVFLWSSVRIAGSSESRRQTGKAALRILVACVAPGLVATLLLSFSIIRKFPTAAFTLGTTSWRVAARTVMDSLLYELNPEIVNPFLMGKIRRLGPYLLLLLGLFFALKAIAILRDRPWRRDPRARRLIEFAAVLLFVLVGSIILHTAALVFAGVSLPDERKALWVVPLCALLAGVVAAVRIPSRTGRFYGSGLYVAFCALAVWFLFCTRLTYFKEWKWNSDSRRLYWIVSWYNRRYDVKDVPSCWRYVAVLNAYWVASGQESFTRFQAPPQTAPPFRYPPDRKVYVLYYPDDEPFIKEHGLKVVYHGDDTGAAIAIRPDLESDAVPPP